MFCTACPEAPFNRLSIALMMTRLESSFLSEDENSDIKQSLVVLTSPSLG